MFNAKLAQKTAKTDFHIAIISQRNMHKQAQQQACSLLQKQWPTLNIDIISELGQSASMARSITIMRLPYKQVATTENVSRETFSHIISCIFQGNNWENCFILQVLPLDICIVNCPYDDLMSILSTSCESVSSSTDVKLNFKSDLPYAQYTSLKSLLLNQANNLSACYDSSSKVDINVFYYEKCFALACTKLNFAEHRSAHFLDLWPAEKNDAQNVISRAEYKLRELSIRLANISTHSPLSRQTLENSLQSAHTLFINKATNYKQLCSAWSKSGSLAFDLGAAPGGWTQVLLNLNYHVIAIDPEHLKITTKQNLWHFQGLSDQFLNVAEKNNFRLFSGKLLVNDMKLFAQHSLSLTAEFLPYLDENAYIVQTIKLLKTESYAKQLKQLKRYISYALKDCQVEFVRQLAANRSEITLVLRKISKRN